MPLKAYVLRNLLLIFKDNQDNRRSSLSKFFWELYSDITKHCYLF